jgi:signal transduction histidine kinase
MIRRLLFGYLTVTALALALLAIPLGFTIAHREKERLLFDIERDADAMAAVVAGSIQNRQTAPRRDLTQYAARTGGHVIVVDQRGRAILDTDHPNDPGRDYSTRPEIQDALRGRRVEGTRKSETLSTTLLYAAVPATVGGRVNGAVRITYPAATLDDRVREVWARLAVLCGGVLAVAAAVGFGLARSVTRPVHRLERATDRVAAGDLSARVDTHNGPPELRHLATTFNRMVAQLTQLLDSQQRFVADASHQLRTPLTALRLRLENLESDASAGNRERLTAAVGEVTRMTRLVDGLLLLASGAGDRDVHTAVDIVLIVRNRAENWSDVTRERGVNISLETPDAAWALATPEAVEQLVDNLVDNALSVSPAGTTICVRVGEARGGVEIHVLDEGPGLEPDERAHAFDRFWRGARAAPGGSGLGLAIVRQLAESCGGSARLEPRPGRGIDAVIVLPRAGRLAPEIPI